MTQNFEVQGTIERNGNEYRVRFSADASTAVLEIAKTAVVKRNLIPGLQPLGGERGKFFVTVADNRLEVTGTHLQDREPCFAPSQTSPQPSNPGRRQTEQAERARQVVPVANRAESSPSGGPAVGPVVDPAAPGPPATIHDRFINPYNFVSLPLNLGEAANTAPFARAAPQPHDCYQAKCRSGFVDCQLTTHTHAFIPDARKSPSTDRSQQHKTLGYFTLDPVPNSWSANDPAADMTKPAIPGSSLRGMVRSIFETATLSCFSVFDSDRLDFRIGYSPDHAGTHGKATGRGTARYVPCRVCRREADGTLGIQLLDGRLPTDSRGDPVLIPVVLVDAYSPKVWEKDRHLAGVQKPNAKLAGNVPVMVICEKDVRIKTKYKHDGKPYHPFRFRKASRPLIPLDHPDAVDLSAINYDPANEMVVFGYFHRTGPNIENKHDERVFFCGEAEYNQPVPHQLVADELRERLQQFLRVDDASSVTVRREVVADTVSMLKGYAGRHGKNLEQPAPRNLSASPQPPYPSDFVQRLEADVEITAGDLFYALIEELPDETTRESVSVHGLYPVAIPRLSHEDSRGDLLPDDFYPCGRRHETCARCRELSSLPAEQRTLCDRCQASSDQLCPACRVFGWTRDLTYYQREDRALLRADTRRVDAHAGHVRFTHATLVGDWGGTSQHRAELITLPILATPHPTATGFYLDPHGRDWKTEKQSRWPPVTGLDRPSNPVAKLPAYRRAEAQLRGRKLYRRRHSTNAQSTDETLGGLKNPGGPDQFRSDQNQTVHALPPMLSFSFRVYFDNLTPEELGALLFALTLRPPQEWIASHRQLPPDPKFFHALGHGKPLGMGRCDVKVNAICLDGVERYAAGNFHNITEMSTGRFLTDDDLRPFFDAWQKLASDEDLLRVRNELLEMLLSLPEGARVIYPPVEIRHDGAADFKWWTTAKKRGITLPDPIAERTEPEQRLQSFLGD